MRSLDKIPRAFKLYQALKSRKDFVELNRLDGTFGIAVKKDRLAVRWQSLNFRLHVVECYITGDYINWYHARWLSNEEADKRNEQQRKGNGR